MNDKDRYKPSEIEPKWQQKWEAEGLYNAVIDDSSPKYYALTMLPYPSGDWPTLLEDDGLSRLIN